MPNHIINELTLIDHDGTYTPEKIKEVFDSFKSQKDEDGEERLFDFNTLVPMPLIFRGGESDGYTMSLFDKLKQEGLAKPASLRDPSNFERAVRLADHLSTTMPQYEVSRDLARKYVEGIRDFGHIDWYGWSCEHWGTKWNAYDEKGDLENTIKFDTAWSTPMPIWKALANKFPGLIWRVRYSDEDTGGSNHGVIYLRDGEVLEESMGADERRDLGAQLRGYEDYAAYERHLREMYPDDYDDVEQESQHESN
jgi:hypothetical protein